ncbi:hypothetical protein BJ508DRAFT_57002 [Ascobolus immersus RN42]|uniref:Kinetochore protein NDC80 n=1 Tax=Ascobolus immersus RN42 TaxID=1160509 RepID=A0A3N4IC82_ASCIM|nr:hypothetical protein BJ508DRAFT_57002 [Ascobolus immersus RN42]
MRQSMAAPRTSSIPAPTHHRQSLAPSRLQRPSSVSIDQDVMGSATRSAGRKSYAPPPSAQRRTSVFQRQSSMGFNVGSSQGGPSGGSGAGPSSFFASSSATNAISQDPRPLRDRSYRDRISTEIMEFLQSNNYEMVMKTNLNPNFARTPTAKDFENIFRFLYHSIDPQYNLTNPKKLDTEIINILKTLRYPFVNNITKSQLAAVGSTNTWPSFLGILHWLMQLVVTTNRISDPAYDSIAEEAGFDPEPDRIQLSFYSETYQAWLNGEDDLSPYEQSMQEAFAIWGEAKVQELEQLEARNNDLRSELAELEESSRPLDELKAHREVLESDIRKFTDWIDKSTGKYNRALSALNIVKSEIDNGKRELAEAERDRDALQAAVDKQGLTPADIDRMNAEQEKLKTALEQVRNRLNEAEIELEKQSSEAQAKLQRIERLITRFNSIGFKVGGLNAQGRTFELRLFPDRQDSQMASTRLCNEDGTGYSPSQIINVDLRHDVKPALVELKKSYTKKIHETEEEAMKVAESVESAEEELAEIQAEVETLRTKKTAVDDEYSEMKENMTTDQNNSNLEIEKLERELQNIRSHMTNGLLTLEQRSQSLKVEYDQLKYKVSEERERLHGAVAQIIENIVNFKVHIGKSLEEFWELTHKEREEACSGEDRDDDEEML